jgi:hypothetical protein
LKADRLSQLALCVALGILLATPAAHAVRKREQENLPQNVPEKGEWRESDSAPPPYPLDSNLVEFKPRGQTTNRFLVDGSSLAVGADRVIRFVLVIETLDKARNVSFAGLRCESKEWKDYAFANPDRSWRVEQNARWRTIEDLTRNNHQYTLFRDYFCYGGVMSGGPAGDAATLVRNLKYPLVQDSRSPRRYNSAPTRGN